METGKYLLQIVSTNTVHANGKQVIRGISPGCITLYIKYITLQVKYITLQVKYIPLGRLTHTHPHPHTLFEVLPNETAED